VRARLSSADQEAGLGRRVARVTARAAGQGLAVTEAGPAMTGKRRGLPALLGDRAVVGTGSGSPGSAPGMLRRRWPHLAAGCWWRTGRGR